MKPKHGEDVKTGQLWTASLVVSAAIRTNILRWFSTHQRCREDSGLCCLHEFSVCRFVGIGAIVSREMYRYTPCNWHWSLKSRDEFGMIETMFRNWLRLWWWQIFAFRPILFRTFLRCWPGQTLAFTPWDAWYCLAQMKLWKFQRPSFWGELWKVLWKFLLPSVIKSSVNGKRISYVNCFATVLIGKILRTYSFIERCKQTAVLRSSMM